MSEEEITRFRDSILAQLNDPNNPKISIVHNVVFSGKVDARSPTTAIYFHEENEKVQSLLTIVKDDEIKCNVVQNCTFNGKVFPDDYPWYDILKKVKTYFIKVAYIKLKDFFQTTKNNKLEGLIYSAFFELYETEKLIKEANLKLKNFSERTNNMELEEMLSNPRWELNEAKRTIENLIPMLDI